MRILLYLEPFPLRCSFTGFSSLAEQMCAPLLASNTVEDTTLIRVYGNRQTLTGFTRQHPQLAAYTVFPTETEQQLFEQHFTEDWNGEGIARWQGLMSGTGAYADAYLTLLEQLHQREPFDILVYWGTNGAARTFGQKHNIPAIAMELGCTRPPYLDAIVADPIGVNGDSVFTQLSAEDLHSITGAAPAVPPLPPLPASSAAMEDIRSRAKGKPIAFLPLQLYDDANLLRFSGYDSMLDFLSDVAPKLHDAGYFLLVKDHPAAYQRISGAEHSRACASYIATFTDSQWLADRTSITNLECFALADAVITVNSSVGFEASLHGLPVVVMGEACYKLQNTFPALDSLLQKSFDTAAYRASLHSLHGFFFRAVLQPKAGASSREYFLHRITRTAALWQTHTPDATAFAHACYATFSETPAIQPMEATAPAGLLQRSRAFILAHPALLRLILPLWRRLRKASRAVAAPPRALGTEKKDVCAIVITYRPAADFPSLLESIRTQVGHTIIVDNGGDAESLALLTQLQAAHPQAITLLQNDANNLARAQNKGIKAALKAGYDWVLLMDHDSRPAPDMTAQLLAAYKADTQPQSIGLLAPFVLNRETDSAAGLKARRKFWFLPRRNTDAPVVDNLHCVIASGSLIPRPALATARMDESLVIDSVDTDFCLQLLSQGRRILAVRDAALEHSIGIATRHKFGPLTLATTNHSPLRRYYQYRNRIILWKRYALHFPSFVIYDTLHAIYEYLRIQRFEQNREEKNRQILAGIKDAVKGVTGERA